MLEKLAAILLVTAVTAPLLSACTTTNGRGTTSSGTAASDTAAYMALGPNAIPVQGGPVLKVPGIYHIDANGGFTEICTKDMSNAALQAIKAEPKPQAGTLEDAASTYAISGNAFGIVNGTLRDPNTRIRVEGYTLTQAESPTSVSVADYIVASVGGTCRDEVMPRNKPYIIVTGVAVADRLYTIRRGAASGGIGIGGLGISVDDSEKTSGPRENATFAVVGTLVPKS